VKESTRTCTPTTYTAVDAIIHHPGALAAEPRLFAR